MSVQNKDRFYKSVSANSTEEQDYVPANGQEVDIAICWGESGATPDTGICVVWDESGVNTLLYSTHNSGSDFYVDTQVTGDGTKAITLKLINNSDAAVTMGAGWSS